MFLIRLPASGVPMFTPQSPFIMSAEDGDGGGGGGDGDGGGAGDGDGGGGGDGSGGDDKTFTQAEVDKFNADTRRKLEAKFKDYDDIKAKAAKVDELTASVTALTQKVEDVGKDATQLERERAERELATLKTKTETLQAQLAEMTGKVGEEATAHRNTKAGHKLSLALQQADVHPEATEVALRTLLSQSELEFSDEGNLTGITLQHDGTRHEVGKLKEAAKSFLEAHTFLAKGAPGGTGSKRPNAGGAGGVPLHEMSSEQRLKLDADRRQP